VLNNSNAVTAGAFLETQLTNYMRVRVAGGYQMINFDNTGSVLIRTMFTIIMLTSSFLTGSTPISRKPCLPVMKISSE